MKKALLIICLAALFHLSPARNKPGTWQDYFSYGNAIKVVDSGDKVFCATLGGLFSVDLDDNTVQTISSRDGLSDAGIQTMAWNSSFKMLLVAYKNSNLDLVYEDRVINLSDILRKQMTGDKTVYNICFHDDAAFLACGFGVVEINLERKEIRGTYIIGDKGTTARVLDVETDGTSLYAATESGILKASLKNSNLLDYRNWSPIADIPHSAEKFSHLEMMNNRLLAVFTRDQQDGDEIYLLNDGKWQRVMHDVTFVNDLIFHAGFVTATSREEVFVYDPSLKLVGRIKEYVIANQTLLPIQTRCAVITPSGTMWIADNLYGLIRLTDNKFEQISPQGPMNNDVFSLTAFQNDLWVATGGRTEGWNNQYKQPVYERLREGEWSYYSRKELSELTGFWDIVEIEVDPRDPEHVFVASWGGGVIEMKNGQIAKRHNNLNSPLQTALPSNPQEPYTRIGGLAFDSENTLWITNSQSSRGLHGLNTKGEWKSIELPEASGTNHRIGQLIVTRDDDKWIVLPSGRDLYVVSKDGNTTRPLPVTSYFNNGSQEIVNRMNDVYSITEDLNGEIWIGTSKGVAVFSNPAKIWEESTYYAWQPSLELNDGLYHPLLETEMITAIVVDGANRKWIGTRSSGIYLISERGDREILHFTASNSPLPSNAITALALNSTNGELFIGTDKGLISYMGDAPQGNDNYSEVYVYPNPVRETYQGDVTITGLMKDTDVKITDIAGNLVHKGKSLGSKLMWDGRNLNGKRVSTGVYLVFCASANGEETKVAKLLFIH